MEHNLDFEHRLTEVEQRSKSNTKRLDEMEHRLGEVEQTSTDVSVLEVKLERMETDVKEIKTDVKSLTEKPGKRWDSIVDKVVWALLAAVLAFLLGRLGL